MPTKATSASNTKEEKLKAEILKDGAYNEAELQGKNPNELATIKTTLEKARARYEENKSESEKRLLVDFINEKTKLEKGNLDKRKLPELRNMKEALDNCIVPPKSKKSSSIIWLSLSVLLFSIGALVLFSFFRSTLDFFYPYPALALLVIAILSGLVLSISVRHYYERSNLQARLSNGAPKTEIPKTPRKDEKPEFFMPLTILVGIMTVATIMLVVLPVFSESVYGLPLSMVFAIVDLLVVLTVASMIMKNLGLSCGEEALGLPRGSVRAIIALSLIVIFSIMAVFMYSGLGPQPYPIAANTTISYANGTIFENPNGTILIREISQAQKDFSLQTLTTVSTLVVAIAAFYFGSKSVETSGNMLKAVGPELTVEPSSIGKKIKKGESVTFKVTTDPEGEKIVSIVKGDAVDSLKEIDNISGVYTYTPKDAKDFAVLSFALASKPYDPKVLTLDIEEKSP